MTHCRGEKPHACDEVECTRNLPEALMHHPVWIEDRDDWAWCTNASWNQDREKDGFYRLEMDVTLSLRSGKSIKKHWTQANRYHFVTKDGIRGIQMGCQARGLWIVAHKQNSGFLVDVELPDTTEEVAIKKAEDYASANLTVEYFVFEAVAKSTTRRVTTQRLRGC